MSTLSSNNKSPLYDCICRIETMSYKIFLKTWSLTMNEIISFPMFFSVSGSHKNNSKRYTLMPMYVILYVTYISFIHPAVEVIEPKPFLQYFPHIKIFFHFFFSISHSNRFLSIIWNRIAKYMSTKFSTVFDVTQCEQLELLKGLRAKATDNTEHSFDGWELYIGGTWTFQTYQQLQLILLALTYIDILERVLCIYIRLCKWLGYCKISKALISVYTINRKMGFKVGWESYFCIRMITNENDLFMYLYSIWKLKKMMKIPEFNLISLQHKE